MTGVQTCALPIYIGIRGYIVGFAYPYDTESMERLANDVRPRLEKLVGIAA